ncbi:stalk domain-containing protein [Paenibacillus sp. GCM10027626]|uniref:stalk domain-containing protein n=1 Tax=Paenibacillus sp. GCM10027626 TaxID=3273411 RepID=UPI00363CE736
MGKVFRKCVMLACALFFAGAVAVADHAGAQAKSEPNQLIVVNKKTNQLAFFEDGKLQRTFKVATGKTSDLTPDGKHKIVNKIKNRPYYKDKIPGGDPRNPLGDRWIGLDIYGTKGTTYAIHGNNNANSIGKYVSAGCIRMYNDEVHWLFDQIKVNSYAVVTSSDLSFEKIAENNGYVLVEKQFDGKIVVNGVETKMKTPFLVSDSRVFVPMRELFEMLGAKVNWDAKTGTATAYVGKRTIVHKPNTDTALVDGKKVQMTPSRMINNKVMLPLRDISTLSQYGVTWDGKKNTIILTSAAPKQEPAKPASTKPANPAPTPTPEKPEKKVGKAEEAPAPKSVSPEGNAEDSAEPPAAGDEAA